MVRKARNVEKPLFPPEVPNWINGRECLAIAGESFEKLNPANGVLI